MALGSNKIDKLTIMIFFDSLVFPNKENRYNSSERNYWQFRPIFRYQELKWRFLSGSWTFMRTFGNRLVKIFDSLQDKICWQQLCHLTSKMLQILRDQFLFQSGTTSVANSTKVWLDILAWKLVKSWNVSAFFMWMVQKDLIFSQSCNSYTFKWATLTWS